MYTVVKDFLGKKGPSGYVAGLGRGATGFTTRADIGPGRDFAGDPLLANTEDNDDEEYDKRYGDDDTGLFASLPYTKEDEDADKVWEAVDMAMDERRKKRREKGEKERLEKFRAENPKIQEQFSDVKRKLAELTEDEWASIPEVGDIRAKKMKKQHKMDRFTPVPDSLLVSARQENEIANSIDVKGGLSTATSGIMTDLKQFGEAREKVLGIKLDQITTKQGSGSQSVDSTGYLTSMESLIVKSDAELGDIEKARQLIDSLVKTNPKHAPGWISAARIEEVAGRLKVARNVIAKGCEMCPQSEDVWLEAARLFVRDFNDVLTKKPEEAKLLLANAVRQIPTSVKLWIQASKFENDAKEKRLILRRGLEFVPDSIRLWKEAIELETDEEDARIMLAGAVEAIPYNVELWLALAKLETYQNARKVLNKARRNCPTSHEIWIAAAKLEEAQSNESLCDTIIQKGVASLAQLGSGMDRDKWLSEAELCERTGNILTCQAIIRATIGMGVDEDDRKHTWIDDAKSCVERGSIHTARAIYAHALQTLPNRKGLWRRAAYFEKEHGSREEMEKVLEKAVKYCPQSHVLWLLWAKERWMSGDLNGARSILSEAFNSNANDENIWLAAFKLEYQNNEIERAKVILEKAREQADSPRVWMKSAVFERQQGNIEMAKEMCKIGISKYKSFDKFYMILGQLEEKTGDISAARNTFEQGMRNCPNSIPLWTLASQLEVRKDKLIIARSILEKARKLNPKKPELWIEVIRLELKGGNTNLAKSLLAKALQECPNSGMLLAESILMEPRQTRKGKSADALKRTDNDPYVHCVIARLFWQERKLEKARSWFTKTVAIDPDNGDFWSYFYAYEKAHGTPEQQNQVIEQCIKADPKHGELWQKFVKDDANRNCSIKDTLEHVSTILPSFY